MKKLSYLIRQRAPDTRRIRRSLSQRHAKMLQMRFSAQQHYAQRAIMLSPVRLSVRHTGGSVKNGWSYHATFTTSSTMTQHVVSTWLTLGLPQNSKGNI